MPKSTQHVGSRAEPHTEVSRLSPVDTGFMELIPAVSHKVGSEIGSVWAAGKLEPNSWIWWCQVTPGNLNSRISPLAPSPIRGGPSHAETSYQSWSEASDHGPATWPCLCVCVRELCVWPEDGYKLPLTRAFTADSCISQNNLAHYDAGRLFKPAHFSSLCLKFQYPALFTRFPRAQFTVPIWQGRGPGGWKCPQRVNSI